MTVLAEGWTTDCERWQLTLDPPPRSATVTVHVTRADGRPYWGTGCGLAPPGELVVLTTGSDDAGPSTLIAQVRADVRAVVVWLSDGTREDLRLHPVPGRVDRVAVLVYRRRLDVQRIDLYDAAGTPFPDPVPR